MATASTPIVAVALLGALGQFVIGLRLYEPPAEYSDAGSSLLEATIFFVAFLLLYAAAGVGLAALVEIARPFGRLLVLLAGAVGLYSVSRVVFGDRDAVRTDATAAMGATTGLVVALLAGTVLLL